MPGAGTFTLSLPPQLHSNHIIAPLIPFVPQCRRLRLRNHHPLHHRRPFQGMLHLDTHNPVLLYLGRSRHSKKEMSES